MIRPSRWRRLVLLIGVLGLLLTGCKVDATVEVRVRDDGSGVVRVLVDADAEAVKTVEAGGVKIEDGVRLSDLSSAGWRVGAWERSDDGAASIALVHPFSSVDEVAGIVRQISGTDGPLQGVKATRESGIFEVDYAVKGRADLANVKAGVPADAELVANLTAQQVDPNVIDQQLLAQVQASFALKVVVKQPGEKAKTFASKPGESVDISAASSVMDTDRIIFLGAAVGFLLLASVVGLRPSRRRGRHSPPRRHEVAAIRRSAPPPSPPPPPARRR